MLVRLVLRTFHEHFQLHFTTTWGDIVHHYTEWCPWKPLSVHLWSHPTHLTHERMLTDQTTAVLFSNSDVGSLTSPSVWWDFEDKTKGPTLPLNDAIIFPLRQGNEYSQHNHNTSYLNWDPGCVFGQTVSLRPPALQSGALLTELTRHRLQRTLFHEDIAPRTPSPHLTQHFVRLSQWFSDTPL